MSRMLDNFILLFLPPTGFIIFALFLFTEYLIAKSIIEGADMVWIKKIFNNAGNYAWKLMIVVSNNKGRNIHQKLH